MVHNPSKTIKVTLDNDGDHAYGTLYSPATQWHEEVQIQGMGNSGRGKSPFLSKELTTWVGDRLTPEQRSNFALAASPIVANNSGGQSSRKSLNTREEDIVKTDQIIVRVFNN